MPGHDFICPHLWAVNIEASNQNDTFGVRTGESLTSDFQAWRLVLVRLISVKVVGSDNLPRGSC